MAASAIAEFKARALREFLLPHSRLCVQARMIDCTAFLGLGELPIPASTDDLTSMAPKEDPQAALSAGVQRLHRTLVYADRAIAMGAVNPRFSQRDEDKDREDVVHVTDLSMPDRLFLGNAILEMIGLSAEWADQVQSFREDPQRPPDPGTSGEVSQAAA